jgi:flagellar motor switch protein FliM
MTERELASIEHLFEINCMTSVQMASVGKALREAWKRIRELQVDAGRLMNAECKENHDETQETATDVCC